MSNPTQSEQIADQAPLTRDEIVSLFRGFLRYTNILQDAIRVGFDESRFKGDEYVFHVLFSAIRELYQQYGGVSKEMLLTTISSWLESGQAALNSQDIVFLFGAEDGKGFIEETLDEPALGEAQARPERSFLENVLRRFMNVRRIKPGLQHILNRSTEDVMPSQIADVLARWGQLAQQVANIGAPMANSAAMPDFGSPLDLPPPAIPTTIPWIDQYIGGFRPGDVIGVLGPFSGGKTTALTTVAVRMAELFHTTGSNKLAVFIGYEDGAQRMNPLAWSASARIDRNLFMNAGAEFWSQLSTRQSLKDYDRQLPENRNGEIMFGERERWELAKRWFNRHFVFLDFSNNASTGGRGCGGVAEIKVALERLMEERGMEIGCVCIDYAGIMVERELGLKGSVALQVDQSALTRPIKQVPDNLRTLVAVPMQTTVMLAHQLAGGEVNKLRPYHYISHLSAAGSKSFAENLHSCLCINTRDPATLVSTINWSKIRTGVPLTPYGLIRMDDKVVDVHLVNNEYEVSQTGRAIVRRDDIRSIAAPPPQQAEAPQRQRAGWDVDPFAGEL